MKYGAHTECVYLISGKPQKKLTVEDRATFIFSVGPGDVDLFFAALSLLPERLGDVRRCTIFRTPSFWEAS
jgi:hypothetical protein